MESKKVLRKIAIAAHQNIEEREFWLNKLSGNPEKSRFPYDYKNRTGHGEGLYEPDRTFKSETFILTDELFLKLEKMSGGSDYSLHMILVAGVVLLLGKYTYGQAKDILLGIPIYKQENEEEFINTAVALRIRFNTSIVFRELVLQVRQTIVEALENQNYPIEILVEQLKLSTLKDDCPLFDVAVLYDGIHDMKYLDHLNLNVIFSFSRLDDGIKGVLTYNVSLYKDMTIRKIISQFIGIMSIALTNVETRFSVMEIVSEREKNQVLVEFNQAGISLKPSGFPDDQVIHRLFEKVAVKKSDDVAVIFEGKPLTYGELNRKSNQLARFIRERGRGPDSIVGVMMDYSLEMIIGIMGVLKAGAAYLPISPYEPPGRVRILLRDSHCTLLLTREEIIKDLSYISLLDFDAIDIRPFVSNPRPQVEDLDALQIPDRSLIDYEKYRPYIGQAMVKNSITIHMSRGCVYNCAYCFKIWPKKYVLRSAENIFEEIRLYYEMGIRRFAFVDDLPNFNMKVSSQVFRLIIQNGLKIHLHFPNGIRGDILTKEYIDLMVDAGTITMDLALETTSPRLQKLIRKNLNLDRLEENIRYITEKYPQVILETQIIHGIPSETEEEALASLDFIKSIRWLHFPYIHILNIYPMSDMAKIAVQHGISREAIERSADLAYHELPETLPFPGSFTRQYQSGFLNEYFLSRERLLSVLPYQMRVLTEDELVQKYSSYLPMEITSFPQFLDYAGIAREELDAAFLPDDYGVVPGFNKKLDAHFTQYRSLPDTGSLRILLLDLSQYFTHDTKIMYDVVEPPLGLMYLMTHLYRTFGSKIHGKIAKARIDFDSYEQLKTLLEDFKPDVIGIRTLNFYRDFFHKTISLMRQWGIDAPIIAGGPYATSSYPTILKDRNINLAVLGEGEITFSEVIGKILENNRKLPDEEILKSIPGIAFVEKKYRPLQERQNREILLLDTLADVLTVKVDYNLESTSHASNLAYIIYTSGSTGTPKGVMIQHNNLANQIKALREEFDLDTSLNYLLLASFTFDVSLMHIFLPLVTGAKLFLIPEETRKDSIKLWKFIYDNKITILNIVPTFMKALLEGIDNKNIYFKYLFVGGDVFPPDLYVLLKETFHVEQIINIYGPTETTINATLYRCMNSGDENCEKIPIGKPLLNYNTYILDKDLNTVPIGLTGELYISGNGVARGYLNNPGLTAERFISNPIASPVTAFRSYSVHNAADNRLFRTGDLACWQPDGNIEFLGRIDHQVKIRGFRVESGEIESQLLKHREIKGAAVVAREDKNGEKYLCAYVVPVDTAASGRTSDTAGLKEFLARTLPDYMIPSHFIYLSNIPLTPNAKLDQSALPAPGTKGGKDNYIAPGNELEKKLTVIWAEVLNVLPASIGIDDNFFQLGGHSLKATILISKIHKILEVKVPLTEMFKGPTIRKLAGYIKELEPVKFASIEPVERKEYYGLSSAQKRLYFLQQFDLNSTGYNLAQVVPWGGMLEFERLTEMFRVLIGRHESLRTSFAVVREKPVQRIHEYDGLKFKIERLRPAAGSGNGETHKIHTTHEEIGEIFKNFIRPFDLSHAPLFRVGVINAGEKKHLLLIDMHHIITDEISRNILVKEFTALYSKPGEALPELKLQYKDYAEWQKRVEYQELIRRQEFYWIQSFSDKLPVLNLPTDYPRPPVQSFEGSTVRFVLTQEESGNLKKSAKMHDVTLFMYILAVFNILLMKLSGQEDIIIGTPIAARRHADLEGIVGMFVNTLPIRIFPQRDRTFTELLQDIKVRTLETFENQEYPFEELVEKIAVDRDTGRNPVYDVVFTFSNQPGYSPHNLGVNGNSYKHIRGTSKFDLTLIVVEMEEELIPGFEYSTLLFESATIDKMIGYFKKILSLVTEMPEEKLEELDLIPGKEKRQILADFNDTRAEYPKEKVIHQLYEEQVGKKPDSIGVGSMGSGEQQHLTYRELSHKSNQLAHWLLSQGVGPNAVVGIMAGRSVEMIIGLLGILKAGGAYLPIDPDYPQERVQYMLQDSQANILLRQSGLIGGDIFDGTSTEIDALFLCPAVSEELKNTGKPADLAYIMYTSGTTARPRGVMVGHRNVIRLVVNANYVALTGETRILQTGAPVFDATTFEVWGALLNGGGLYLVENEAMLSADRLGQAMVRNKINTLWLTSPLFNQLCRQDCEIFFCLDYLLVGGDVLSPRCINRVRSKNKNLKVINGYGPTENTTFSTTFLVDRDYEAAIPIGRPIHNSTAFILDKDDRLQPIGIPGQLCVGGDGVSRGYLNSPELTAEKFVDLAAKTREETRSSENQPLNPESQILYRTGDIARWLMDGNIEFLGRMDNQVKIRGFRIEPAEIENQLVRHDGVREAVVIDRKDEMGESHLYAYVVPSSPGSAALNIPGLRVHLLQELPGYMVPSYFVQVEEIPLNTNGKVDRSALLSSKGAVIDLATDYAPLKNKMERQMVGVWKEVLNRDKIGRNDNFFDLGGNSLSVISVVNKLKDLFGMKLSVAAMFQYPTVGSLSQYLAGEGSIQKPTGPGSEARRAAKTSRQKQEFRRRRR
jgi:amino acid adenylation domain-containing protein